MNNHTKTFVYNISYKTLIGAKPLRLRFNKIDRSFRVYDGTRYCLEMKNMISFITELDILQK